MLYHALSHYGAFTAVADSGYPMGVWVEDLRADKDIGPYG